jgi:hypothetical protein
VRLRAGIRKALELAEDNALTYANIGEAVRNALNLPFLDFANKNEEPQPWPRSGGVTKQCFQEYLVYRAIADLRRSWRIVLPNLEQVLCSASTMRTWMKSPRPMTFWKAMPLLNQLEHAERKEFIGTILDFFRLEFAIESENYLTQSRIKEYEKQFRELLRSPWTLDRNEELVSPFSSASIRSTRAPGCPPRAWGRRARWASSSSSMFANEPRNWI